MPPLETLLTIRQVAKLAGLSTRSVWRLVAEARTPEVVRIGRLVRLRASDVDLWLRMGCPDRGSFNAAKEGKR